LAWRDIKELLDGTVLKEMHAVMKHISEDESIDKERFLEYVDSINSLIETAKEILKSINHGAFEEVKGYVIKKVDAIDKKTG